MGNTQQGVVLGSRNATVGGTDPQDSNVIGGNGMQGVLIEPGASGNQVLGNQIGVAGPSSSGVLLPCRQRRGRGVDPVVGNRRRSVDIVYASSNTIGGAVGGAGNLISATTPTASTSRASARPATSSRPTISARRPAADITFGRRAAGQPRRRRVHRRRTR